MDIFFRDPNEVPLPPDEVKIRQFRAEPRPDGVRVRIYLEVDPFQKKPSAEITIRDPQGNEAASVSIVESVTRRMELTMHLRTEPQTGIYTAHAVLLYSEVIRRRRGPIPAAERYPGRPGRDRIQPARIIPAVLPKLQAILFPRAKVV